MTVSIEELIVDEDLVALTYRQVLEPVEGRAASVRPPAYPVPSGKRAREAERLAESTINEIANGVRVCELDTVHSQANRSDAPRVVACRLCTPDSRPLGEGY